MLSFVDRERAARAELGDAGLRDVMHICRRRGSGQQAALRWVSLPLGAHCGALGACAWLPELE